MLSPLIKKQIDELDENDVALFKQAGKDFSLSSLSKQVRAINSEYMDNMGQILLDEIRRDNYRSNIITTNEQAKEFEDTRKKEFEEAAKKLVKSAKKNLNDFVNVATEEELAKAGWLNTTAKRVHEKTVRWWVENPLD